VLSIQRGGVEHRLHFQIDPHKTAHRLAVLERVFESFIGQSISVVVGSTPQHPLQAHGLSPTLPFEVEGLDTATSFTPGRRCLHFVRNSLSTRLLFFYAYSAWAKLLSRFMVPIFISDPLLKIDF
jgi:hypothetical protein